MTSRGVNLYCIQYIYIYIYIYIEYFIISSIRTLQRFIYRQYCTHAQMSYDVMYTLCTLCTYNGKHSRVPGSTNLRVTGSHTNLDTAAHITCYGLRYHVSARESYVIRSTTYYSIYIKQ